MKGQVTERLAEHANEAAQKALADIDSRGLRDPWNLGREAIDLSNSLLEIMERNPDPDVVQSYATSISALLLQIAIGAPVHFTTQQALPMGGGEVIDISDEAA